MLRFFTMIFEGFIWLASFFGNVATWFSSLARWAMFSKAIKFFIFGMFYAFILLYIVSAVAFFYYVIQSIIQIYNLISMFLNYIEAFGGADTIISAFYYFLTISGVVAGFEACFPFIASALIFILMKSLWKITMYFYLQVLRILNTVFNAAT